MLIAGWLFIARKPARAVGLQVGSHFDDSGAGDVNPGDCTCADIFGAFTLRAAIQEVNACSGIDTITFSKAVTITLDTSVGGLPSLDEQVTIDGHGGSFSGARGCREKPTCLAVINCSSRSDYIFAGVSFIPMYTGWQLSAHRCC